MTFHLVALYSLVASTVTTYVLSSIVFGVGAKLVGCDSLNWQTQQIRVLGRSSRCNYASCLLYLLSVGTFLAPFYLFFWLDVTSCHNICRELDIDYLFITLSIIHMLVGSMASAEAPPRDQALSYFSNLRFNQEFIIPRTVDHDAITVSYADVGFQPESQTASRSTPTVLFIPGMFGSRYIGAVLDPVARKFGVRVLVVDRPGMGRSTGVPLPQRLSTWIQLVPLLLAHLDIGHVALVAHSAGTMYLLNTLHHYRSMLHPERPFVAFMAPWVDPAHSKVTTWQMAQYIPTRAFGLWNHITPAFATSGTIFNKANSFFSSSIGAGEGQELSSQDINRQKLASTYGIPRDTQLEVESVLMKKIFDENTSGANDEALQCLRKGKGWSWGECDDYSVFVTDLVSTERQRKKLEPGFHERMKLKVRAYFAESDVMIGVGGQKYMEHCWGWQETTFDDVVDFNSVTVAGTNHDSVVQSIEVLEKLFADAGGSLVR
ncbi:Alpha/Beta hydrolase protein [Trichoderma chlorosporum]